MTKIKPSALVLFLTLLAAHTANAQTSELNLEISIAESVRTNFSNNGRLFIFLSSNPQVEPRTQIWPNPTSRTTILARNMENWDPANTLHVDDMSGWVSTAIWDLHDLPHGTYYIQALWDQDVEESRISAPGNMYSTKKELVLDGDETVKIELSELIKERSITESPLAKVINFKSDILSQWWGKDMYLKASILLPKNYEKGRAYPIRYNVAGYGGRYTRINYLLNSEEFMTWWQSDEAPEIISVFLDGEGPFGDSYQMNSENSGPYGDALINELIPHIENEYRGTSDAATRYVDGCSTGGWVSLGLQLYYPDIFGGVFSYSPDAIEFQNYQLINIYEDKNAYINEFGMKRPVMRSIYGEPMLSLEDFINYENVLSPTNTYVKSGGQFSAHTALYSPKGDDGLPKPLFDPVTGEIDPEVAEHWKKYDFKLYAEKNWEELGPKLQGKIYIWMGDMDQFYLNNATRSFAEFLEATDKPKSDAIIEFDPMKGHCQNYNYAVTLRKLQEILTAEQ